MAKKKRSRAGSHKLDRESSSPPQRRTRVTSTPAPETRELQGHVYTRLDLVLAAVKLRDAELLQLVREALQHFTEDQDPENDTPHLIDVRDWVKSARAVIAQAEGR